MASRAAPAPPPPQTDPYAALRVRDFRLYLIGNFIGTMGMEMVTVAVGWDLYERTGSALALGGVGLAQVLPVFLLTLPAGHVSIHVGPGASRAQYRIDKVSEVRTFLSRVL